MGKKLYNGFSNLKSNLKINLMKENYFKNFIAEFWIENGILYLIYQQEAVVDKEAAIYLIKERHKMTNKVSYPMFVDLRGMKYITRDAREELKKGDGIKYVTAGAFLINNTIIRILSDYFIKFDKPPIPIKLFTDQEKALQWLQQFKNRENLPR